MGNKPTIAISHLGCEKNRIDSEHMLGLLAKAGYPVDNDEELADYVIVNTCSFIQAAREESVRTLVELAEANKKIIISGCMAQHFQDELLTELPEAVAIVGTGDYQKIVEIVERVETGERVKEVSTDPTFIADRRLRLSLCFLYYSPPARRSAIEIDRVHCQGSATISQPRSPRINSHFANNNQLWVRLIWRTQISGTLASAGRSRYTLDSRSLRLPDRVNAKGYRGDPRDPECFTLSRFAATAFPSPHPAGDEPSLARTSQRWHYRADQASYPERGFTNDFYRRFPRRNRGTFQPSAGICQAS